MTQNFNDDAFGLYEATCQACDGHARVNDIGLCETCDGKMDRDLILMREWAYSVSAFGCPEDIDPFGDDAKRAAVSPEPP